MIYSVCLDILKSPQKHSNTLISVLQYYNSIDAFGKMLTDIFYQ